MPPWMSNCLPRYLVLILSIRGASQETGGPGDEPAHEVAPSLDPDGKIGGVVLFILVLRSSRVSEKQVVDPLAGKLAVYAVVFDELGRIEINSSRFDIGIPVIRISCTIWICSMMCPVAVGSILGVSVLSIPRMWWKLRVCRCTNSIGSSCSRRYFEILSSASESVSPSRWPTSVMLRTYRTLKPRYVR